MGGLFESSMAMHHLVLVALIFAAACATVRADCDPSDDWVGKTYTGASDIPNPSDPHGDPLGTAQWCLTVTKPPENDKDQYMSLGVDASINDGAKHQCDFTGLPVIISNGDVGTTQCGYSYGTRYSDDTVQNWTHSCSGAASSEMLLGYGFVNNYLRQLTIQGAINGSAANFDSSKEWPQEMMINASYLSGNAGLPNVTLSLGKCIGSSSGGGGGGGGLSMAVIIVIIVAVLLVLGVGVGGFFWWKNKQEADNAAASSYTPSLMSNQQHQQQNQAESQENANKGKWGV